MDRFGQTFTAIAAIVAAGVSFWNTRKINEIHVIINSRLTELLALTKTSSKAEGVKEGRESVQ